MLITFEAGCNRITVDNPSHHELNKTCYDDLQDVKLELEHKYRVYYDYVKLWKDSDKTEYKTQVLNPSSKYNGIKVELIWDAGNIDYSCNYFDVPVGERFTVAFCKWSDDWPE